jgi:hypothetical protein
MAFRLEIAPSVTLAIDEPIAQGLLDQLLAQGLRGSGSSPPMVSAPEVLADDHALWNDHSGGSGHSSQEWGLGDEERAEVFYAGVSGKAKVLLDLFIDRPGRRLSTDEIRRLAPNVFGSDHSIAGSLNGLRKLKEASGRRYPFYWWKGTRARYAMKPSVAALFEQARTCVGA